MEKIFLALLLVSFSVLTYFLIKKAPELAEFDEGPSRRKPGFLFKIKKRISKISHLSSVWGGVVLQKVLSKTRVVLLKVENKIGSWLYFLRKKSERKK